MAVQDCDMAEIEACLDAGADLAAVGLIHECVSTDDLQIVTALLARGGQVNQRDADGRTPLHCAQSRGVADVLLRAGADTTARDANGLTPVEERRAFGVRGLNEVADFIASWSGKTDLKPRNMDEILKEETAIRDEISRLQSAVSQMSGAGDSPQGALGSPEVAAPPSPPSVVNRQREEYARARGLLPTATWEEITEFDAAQRGPDKQRPPVANSPPATVSPQAAFAAESAAFAAGESGTPAFAARDRLARSPPREDPSLAYDFEDAEQLGDGDKEEKETSPFAARTELPRSPKRANSMGSLGSPLADDEPELPSRSASQLDPEGSRSYRYGALETAPFRSNSGQRTNSGSSPGRSSRGGRSPTDRERLLATVEALAAAEAEIEATVEEAEAAAAEAEARSAAAAARAEAARERARLEASRASAGFGSGSRLQLSPEGRRAGGDSAIPADVGELLRACLRGEVMAAAHRRISDHDNQQVLNKDADAVVSTFGALFRFVAQLTRLGDSQQEIELWQMLRQTVDGASPRPASSYQLNRRGQPDAAASGSGGGYSFDAPARTGSGERLGGAVSRSAIDDSSAARRAELRRLTQNLVTTATDRTAAALRDSGLDRSGSGGINGDGTTWRTPGGLEYSSPPTRTGSGGSGSGSGSGSARSARQEETASPPVGLRSPPAISSIERRRRQQNTSGTGGERAGRPSPPVDRAASVVAVASQQEQWRSSPKPAAGAAPPPTPGKAWIEIEETPLRPPPSAGGNSGGYSGAIGGPDDDPFADASTPSAAPEAPISVSQLRVYMQEHATPATPPVAPDATEQGGGEDGADAAATAAKREKVRKIREERQLAKQQAEVRARDKAEQALRDKQMREARQERRLSEKESRIAEVKAKKRTPSRAPGGAGGTPDGGSGLDGGMSGSVGGDLSARGGDLSATM